MGRIGKTQPDQKLRCIGSPTERVESRRGGKEAIERTQGIHGGQGVHHRRLARIGEVHGQNHRRGSIRIRPEHGDIVDHLARTDNRYLLGLGGIAKINDVESLTVRHKEVVNVVKEGLFGFIKGAAAPQGHGLEGGRDIKQIKCVTGYRRQQGIRDGNQPLETRRDVHGGERYGVFGVCEVQHHQSKAAHEHIAVAVMDFHVFDGAQGIEGQGIDPARDGRVRDIHHPKSVARCQLEGKIHRVV